MKKLKFLHWWAGNVYLVSKSKKMIKKLLLPIVMLLSMQLSAQNLVNNGSFEILDKKGDTYWPKTVKDWIFGGVCYNCNNDNTNFLHTNMGLDRRCDQNFYSYLDGKTKIWFDAVMYKGMDSSGGGFIYTRLRQPTKLGSIYKVTINFYFPSISLVDTAMYRHIGFNLLKNQPGRQSSFSNWKFTNDTLIFDQWYQKTWFVRTLCELEYLVIGMTFTKKWPTLSPKDRIGSEYYIDDVSMVEVDEATIDKDSVTATPFCKCKEIETISPDETFETRTLWYQTNEYTLTDSMKVVLDQLAQYCKKNPKTTFEISGFTDDQGDNHLALSQLRVDECIAYLHSTHKINPLRLVPKYVGNIVKSYQKDALRKANRKVEISRSALQLEQVIYQKALSTRNQDSIFNLLRIWLAIAPDKIKILPIFDPRLDAIKSTKKWTNFVEQIKSSYRSAKKPQEAFWLDSLKMEDQKYRTLEYDLDELCKPFEGTDKMFAFPKLTNEQWVQLDSINYAAMSRFIDQKGWPNQSEVGDRSSRAAFYIVDHYLDTVSFKKYLPILEKKCLEGEAEWRDFAIMTDRLEQICGRPQKYCEQYAVDPNDSNRYVLAPYDSEEAVNARRRKIGLQPIRNFNISFTMKITHLK